jgi:iron(III) transport system substrate-binding protein
MTKHFFPLVIFFRLLYGFVFLPFAFVTLFPANRSLAQPREEMIYVSGEQIAEGAKKEGKLLLHPALRPEYDKATLPDLIKAFGKKYPFVQPTWGVTKMGNRPNPQHALDELVAGKAVVDILGFSGSFPSEYPEKGLLKKYQFKEMAKNGQIKIPPEMIDETGIIVWSSSNTGIITYNSTLVAPDKAPKGWESCVEPQWRGKFSVDSDPNTLTWLIPRWGEEKLFDFARRLKANDALFSRGNTRNLGSLAEGKLSFNCGMYIHPMSRMLKKDAALPIKMVIPDPFPITLHDPQAIYVGAKNPHAGLLWLEFLASREAQEIIDSNEPGRGSFLVEGNLVNKLAKNANVSVCNVNCLLRGNKIAERIAVEIWGLPGSRPTGR